MSAVFQNISIDDAKLLLGKDATIVDIRDDASYAAGHIEQSIHLSDRTLSDFIQRGDFDKPLLVVCYHGHSSQHAAQFLAEQGFEEVYSLIGGYTAWNAAPT